MIATRPLRRMTLHLSHIFFTDALTFMYEFPNVRVTDALVNRDFVDW